MYVQLYRQGRAGVSFIISVLLLKYISKDGTANFESSGHYCSHL